MTAKLAALDAERALVKVQAVRWESELYDSLMGLHGGDRRAWAREEANRRRRQGVSLMDGNLNFRVQAARLVFASEADAITTAR